AVLAADPEDGPDQRIRPQPPQDVFLLVGPPGAVQGQTDLGADGQAQGGRIDVGPVATNDPAPLEVADPLGHRLPGQAELLGQGRCGAATVHGPGQTGPA